MSVLKLLHFIVILLILLPSAGAEDYTIVEHNEGNPVDSSHSNANNAGYPPVDSFFGTNASRDGFFQGNNLSNASMFEGDSQILKGQPPEDTKKNTDKVNEYGLEVRDDVVDSKQEKKGLKEDSWISTENINKENATTQRNSPSKDELSRDIKRASVEQSVDPRVRSVLETSRGIRESLFGKAAVQAEEGSLNTKAQMRVIKEESVRF